jgi:peptide/nickel transport system ATP-binding protein
VVAGLCDRVLVMHGGEEKESGRSTTSSTGRAPYTRALLAAVPRLDKAEIQRLASLSRTRQAARRSRRDSQARGTSRTCTAPPLLTVEDLRVHFKLPRRRPSPGRAC